MHTTQYAYFVCVYTNMLGKTCCHKSTRLVSQKVNFGHEILRLLLLFLFI